jgi:hypothetical protein
MLCSPSTKMGRRALLYLLALGLGLPPKLAFADRWSPDDPITDEWVATAVADASLRAAPSTSAERLALLRSGIRLRVVNHAGEWARVYDPRRGTTGYVHQELVAPAEPPGWFAYSSPPAFEAEFSDLAIATEDLPIYYYPSPDPRAQATVVDAGGRESVVGTVTGDDGASWLVTDDGYYFPAEGTFLASAPGDFDGRWLDVSLSGAARAVAYDAGDTVRSFYAIKGTARFPTPVGAWSIVRRVANETMDSRTLGIPINAPGGYLLKNVLYTQYFRGSGESLHYNWWSSAWGAPGSHGCLGLSLGDARWLWDWANVGTPVMIHA